MLRQIKILKNRKGLSEIVGYVLLITFAVIMGAIVYAWMSSYVLTEKTECPQDVSLVVKSYYYDCSSGKLEITFQNKGLFNISAFKIRGSTDLTKETATIPFSGTGGTDYQVFPKSLSPDGEPQTREVIYTKTNAQDPNLAFVEISPYVFENGKSHICTNAKIKQDVNCCTRSCIGTPIPCRDRITQTQCNFDSGCSFVPSGTCSGTPTDICIGFSTESTCESTQDSYNCYWTYCLGSTPTLCTSLDATHCQTQLGCELIASC